MAQADTLSTSQKAWAAAAAAFFLVSLAWLGFAITTRSMMAFAIGWPLLQVVGYTGALRRAHGDTAHYLFKAQVILQFMVVCLVAALLLKVTA